MDFGNALVGVAAVTLGIGVGVVGLTIVCAILWGSIEKLQEVTHRG